MEFPIQEIKTPAPAEHEYTAAAIFLRFVFLSTADDLNDIEAYANGQTNILPTLEKMGGTGGTKAALSILVQTTDGRALLQRWIDRRREAILTPHKWRNRPHQPKPEKKPRKQLTEDDLLRRLKYQKKLHPELFRKRKQRRRYRCDQDQMLLPLLELKQLNHSKRNKIS